ncbi:hypothetical protein SS50377_22342 [Spironucleus salmonicida]|uniref:Uncharacterized protein n=1 Tax=Spironucleus salmonicida TaxID=348837 RepID=V6LD64_9EUKA|nr:hypothetical protein SS50377_22342 [Spironucleus salmonicida]|eukprot:EST42163.1 Hypothetical protein SS50377_18471 [Spironucleus salmonicida]
MYHIQATSLTLEQIVDLCYLIHPSFMNEQLCSRCRMPQKLLMEVSPNAQVFQYHCKCGIAPAAETYIFNQAFSAAPFEIVPIFVKTAQMGQAVGCAFYAPLTYESGKMCILNKGFDRSVTEFRTELMYKMGSRGTVAIFCDTSIFEWFADLICVKVENGDQAYKDSIEKVEVIAENASYLSRVQGWA